MVKIKTLILYGHHQEERNICRRIAEGYQRRFTPDSGLVQIVPLEQGVPAGRLGLDIYPFQEIGHLIQVHKPEIIVDMHHSKGADGEFFKKHISLFGFEAYLKVSCPAINDPRLIGFLKRKVKGVPINYVDIVRGYRFNGILNDIFLKTIKIAEENRTTLLNLETYLQGEGWNFPDSRHNEAAMEKTIEFLHQVQEYTERKSRGSST